VLWCVCVCVCVYVCVCVWLTDLSLSSSHRRSCPPAIHRRARLEWSHTHTQTHTNTHTHTPHTHCAGHWGRGERSAHWDSESLKGSRWSLQGCHTPRGEALL